MQELREELMSYEQWLNQNDHDITENLDNAELKGQYDSYVENFYGY